MRWQPVLKGVLVLALLEAALSSRAASGRVGQLLEGVAGLVAHVLSPTVPAIPDLRGKSLAGAAEQEGKGAGDLAGGLAGGLARSTGSTSGGSSATFPAEWTTSASSLFV